MSKVFDVIIIGGGAAGFYAAIHTALNNSTLTIAILEQSPNVLSKVKVSGGGRCNVTTSIFDPKTLVSNYPRGNKALLGPFYTHGPEQVVDFFEENGVPLKTEEDGRIFPQSNSSSSIVNCLIEKAKELPIEIIRSSSVNSLQPINEKWEILTKDESYLTTHVIVACGSSKSVWKLLEKIGIPIIAPVPSLFTFNIKDRRIEGLSGIATEAEVTILDKGNLKNQIITRGPLLITHWGMSGPAILKASSFGARLLSDLNYHFEIVVNWLPQKKRSEIENLMETQKRNAATKTIAKSSPFDLSKRLWFSLCINCGIDENQQWAQLTSIQLQNLIDILNHSRFKVHGKSTFKEEFVSAGGVDLDAINFKTMESKTHKGLYFAGEVIDVDAITGGFNFQNAWTTAYIAALDIAYS